MTTWPCVLFVLCLFVILVVCHFGFEGRALVLIAPIPGHCLTFYPLYSFTFLWLINVFFYTVYSTIHIAFYMRRGAW